MSKKIQTLLGLLVILSMLLGACTTTTQAPVATEAPQAAPTNTPAPAATEAPKAEPTAEPTEEPKPDFAALFTQLIADMPADKGYSSIKASSLNEELVADAPFLLDVREASEVEKDGYIEGAVNIPVREVLKNLDKLPGLDEPIVIYCASGHRGALAMAALKMMGYTNVRNLGGGLGAWKKAELPVVTGSVPEAPAAISTAVIENAALYAALDEFMSGIPDGFYTMKVDALAEALTGTPPFLVDVRSAAELEKDGYIEGSVHIPFPEFMSHLDQLPADMDASIVVYCASGHRGAVAMMALRFLGYTDVVNLGGGLGAWKTANMPVMGGALDWNAIWSEFLTNMPAGYYTIKPDALNTALVDDAPFILDVREASEVEKDGYITGAVNIPVREVLKNLDKLPALDQPIVVYCASGHRGAFVMAALRILGYTDVNNLAGGLGGWKKAEFAVETGAPAAPVAGSAPSVDAKRLADLDAWLSALPDGFATVKAADLNTELVEGSGDEIPVIVDTRTADEFASGYIEGAINIPINDLMANLAQLPDKDAKIVILCQSGHRGALGLMALSMLGYTDIRNLGGGMNAWISAELPVVK